MAVNGSARQWTNDERQWQAVAERGTVVKRQWKNGSERQWIQKERQCLGRGDSETAVKCINMERRCNSRKNSGTAVDKQGKGSRLTQNGS